MTSRRRSHLTAAAVGAATILVCLSSAVSAQGVIPNDTLAIAPPSQPLTPPWDFRSSPSLLHSPSVASRTLSAGFFLVPATATLVTNSTIPYSQNDGSLWSGRGANFRLTGGVAVFTRRLRVVIAPELVRSGNKYFSPRDSALYWAPEIPPDRSIYTLPWYAIGPYSVDYPIRFGNDPISRIEPGQSSALLVLGAVEAGFATENMWWGPGQHNALILSNNAPGFPHLTVRSGRPLGTPLGDVEFRWLVGGLKESKFFDTVSSNNSRSMAAAAVSFRPRVAPGLALGFARAVMSASSGGADFAGRWFDVLVRTPVADSPPSDSALTPGGREQLLSLFAKWEFPAAGFDVWTEWGRMDLPTSLRDLLVATNHTQAYTLGLSWRRKGFRDDDGWRIQVENTTVEQSPTFRERSHGVWYTSRRVIQGWTHRGQVLGAAVGPGSSGQRLDMEYFTPRWTAGFYAGRHRYNEDVRSIYTQPRYQAWCTHDINLLRGLRGSAETPIGFVTVDVTRAKRIQPWFQVTSGCPRGDTMLDLHNTTLSVTFSPSVHRPRKRPTSPAGTVAIATAPLDSVAAPLESVAVAFSPDTAVPIPAREWVAFAPSGGEEEEYLRYLQLAGRVAPYPWSLRGFSPRETKKLSVERGSHPWSGRFPFTDRSGALTLLPIVGAARHNASFPYGSGDGAVWAGRGVTVSGTAGAVTEAGPISLVAAPTAFVSQNSAFTLLENGFADTLRFADGLYPTAVDRPQRFGEGSYGRLDAGQSTLRLDVGPASAGVSTANLIWGPSTRYPFLLGTNAPGFPHGFVGTSQPLNLWIGHLHGRVIWGRLEQSDYSPVSGSETYVSFDDPGRRRFASGIIATVTPRGVNGLEFGIARFVHSPWPASGLTSSHFRKPFQSFLKRGLEEQAPGSIDALGDNQLVSAFARWAVPAARTEVYAEYGREDHSWDMRDFVQEPDHSRAYGLGFRRALHVSPTRLDGLRFELINFQLPHLVRSDRGEGGIYTHGVMRQGHTHRGQLLGADVAVGTGAGLTLAWDRYTRGGRTTIAAHRSVRQERSTFFQDGAMDPGATDVQYALEGERLQRFPWGELSSGIAIIGEYARDFRAGELSSSLFVRARIPLAGTR